MSSEYTEQLQAFLLGKYNNAWIHHGDIAVYVRRGHHTLPPLRAIVDTFDVANIDVPQAKQKQGIFTRWLTMAEELAYEQGFTAVFVESVLNPHLARFLTKRGYTKSGPDECPNFFRYCVSGTASSGH